MMRIAKTRVGAADTGLAAPTLPQAVQIGDNAVIDDLSWDLITIDGNISVLVARLESQVAEGSTIWVYFGDAQPQHLDLDSDTSVGPYYPPFFFKAGELPDGPYEVHYELKGVNPGRSPSVNVVVVNSPDRQGVEVDHIKVLPVSPNNAPPGQNDGVHVQVCNKQGDGVPNAWVIFYGPDDPDNQNATATIETPLQQTGPDGHASTNVSYPEAGTITVAVWSGGKFQEVNPVYGLGEGYSLGLQPGPDDKAAYADGEDQHQAMAVVKYGGELATGNDQQQLVDFTLPSNGSTIFVNDASVSSYSPKAIKVKTQGGYAYAAFTDDSDTGETVKLSASFDTPDLAPSPAPLPFTFKPDWELDLSKEVNGKPADGNTPDKALATVTHLGKSTDDTPVEFQLDKVSSATFRKDIPNIQSWGEKSVVVATSGGTAEAWFVDGKAETATLTAFLLGDPKIPSNPPSLQFQFVSTTHDYKLQIAIANNNAAADSLSQNEATATFTDGGNPSQGTIVFTFEGDSSARFVDTGDPNIVQVTDKKIWVNTNSDGVAKADFVDDNNSGEGVTVTASVQGLPDVLPQPPSLAFTFNSVASNRGVLLFPLANYANADSTQQDTCLALLTENGAGTDGTIVFTLPEGKSASFVDPHDAYTTFVSPTEIRVKTQNGGFATVSFTDSNGAGETVTLKAYASDTKPATQPFVFNAVGTAAEYTIQLHVDKNNQHGDGGSCDSATATVYKEGVQLQEPEEKTVVFILSPLSNSANFANNPDLLGYLLKILEVNTQNGQAQALVFDNAAETVKLHATLKDGTAVPATPVELTFTAGSYNIDLDNPDNVDNQPAGGPLDKCIAHVTWEGQDVDDGTVVQFDVNKSAEFDTTGVYKVISPQCIQMKTSGGKASAQFYDSNLSGEVITITVSLPNNEGAGTRSKTFTFTPAVDQYYKLAFNKVQDGVTGTLNPDQYAKGQAVVTKGGNPPTEPVTVKFQAPNRNVNWPDDWTTDSGVGTSGNWIEMETGDGGIVNVNIGDPAAETVTITASLPDHTEVQPQSQDFAFTEQKHTIKLLQLVNWAIGNESAQNRVMAQVMNASGQLDTSYSGKVVFTLKDSAASFAGPSEVNAISGLATADFVCNNPETLLPKGVTIYADLEDGSASQVSQDFGFTGSQFTPLVFITLDSETAPENPEIVDISYEILVDPDILDHTMCLSIPLDNSAYFPVDQPKGSLFSVLNPKCCQGSMSELDSSQFCIADTNPDGKTETVDVTACLIDMPSYTQDLPVELPPQGQIGES